MKSDVVERPRLWPVALSCVAALVTLFAFSLLAVEAVRSLYPDLPERAALEGLPGLLAASIAAAAAFVVTTVIASGGAAPAALRLVPGRETSLTLVLAVVGTLALGQMLDSSTVLAGLSEHGNMKMIRRALAQAVGPELVLTVLVVGVLVGTAEEIFFRGYMQTRLVQRLSRRTAVVVTSLCFGAFHMDPLHGLLALVLGLYLGWITELTGSALPAIVCHVVNNALFAVLTALWGAVGGLGLNIALGLAGALVFAGCVLGLAAGGAAPSESHWLTSAARRAWNRLRR